MSFDDEDTVFQVLLNGEGQYSLWPANRETPRGWSTAGQVGSKHECLDYIEQAWTDMRPLSLRTAALAV
jgi:MbtH protein